MAVSSSAGPSSERNASIMFTLSSIELYSGAYVTFRTVEDAMSAMSKYAFAIVHEFGSKTIRTSYAERLTASQKRARESSIQCTSSTVKTHVPGLLIIDDFLSTEQEREALEVLNRDDAGVWHEAFSRRVAHFGYSFDYDTNEIDRDSRDRTSDMPIFMKAMAKRVVQHLPPTCREHDVACDQCTANEYHPGQGIRPHIDTVHSFTSWIASVCMGSGAVFSLRHQKTGAIKHVYHKPRSLLLMTGESRYEWQHMIAPRKADVVNGEFVPRAKRISLTFRKVLTPACAPTTMTRVSALRPFDTERRFVHAFYDVVSRHFDKTRVIPWAPVERFVEALGERSTAQSSPRSERVIKRPRLTSYVGAETKDMRAFRRCVAKATQTVPSRPLLLDVGMGNGKYASLCDTVGVTYVGGDRCRPLLRLAADKDPHVTVTQFDALHLPFPCDTFDASMSIAVIHHIASTARRAQAIHEMMRVTKIGGLMLISAWIDKIEDDTFVPWSMQRQYLSSPQSRDAKKLVEVAEKDDHADLITLQRYVHYFRRDELKSLVHTTFTPKKRLAVVGDVEYKKNIFLCVRVVCRPESSTPPA